MTPSRDGAEFVPVDGEPAGSSYQAHDDSHNSGKMGSQHATMTTTFNDSLKGQNSNVNNGSGALQEDRQQNEAARIRHEKRHGEAEQETPTSDGTGMESAAAAVTPFVQPKRGEASEDVLHRIAAEAAASEGQRQNHAGSMMRKHSGDTGGMDVDTTPKEQCAHDFTSATVSSSQNSRGIPTEDRPRVNMPAWMHYEAFPPVSSANIPAHLADNGQGLSNVEQVLQRVPERPMMPRLPSPWDSSQALAPSHKDAMAEDKDTPTTTSNEVPVSTSTASAPVTSSESSAMPAAPSVHDLRNTGHRKSPPSFEQYRRRQSWNTVGSNAWEQTLGDVHSVLPIFSEPSANVEAAKDNKDVAHDGEDAVSAAPKTKEASTSLGISENVEMPGLIPGDQIPVGSWGTASPEDETKFEPRYCTIADDEYAVLASAAAYATAAMTYQSVPGGDKEDWEPLDREQQEEVASRLRAWAGLDGPKRQVEARRVLQQTNDKYRVKMSNEGEESRSDGEVFPPNIASHYQTQLHSLTDNYHARMQKEKSQNRATPFVTSVDMPDMQAHNRQLVQDEQQLQAHFSNTTHPEEQQSRSAPVFAMPTTNAAPMSTPAVTTAIAGPPATEPVSAPDETMPLVSSDLPMRRSHEEPMPMEGGKKARRSYSETSPSKSNLDVPTTASGATSASTPAISTPAYTDSETRSMAFPSQGPPQVPISGWSSELEAPVSPLMADTGAEDPIHLLSASAYASGLDIKSPQVRDELLQYAHHLYSTSVAVGEKSELEKTDLVHQKAPRRSTRGGTKLHPTLLPLLHALHKLHPEHLPTLLLLSCTYYTSGNLAGSLWYNNLILRIDSNYVEAMSNIGTALRALGYWKEAESWWWRALQLLPGYWDAFENLLGVLCSPAAAGADSESRPPQFETALRLCDFVEAHIIPVRSKIMLNEPKDDPRFRVQREYSAGTMESQLLPQQLPITQLPRVQNLFYAKGNLKYVIEEHGVASAAEEYQRAVEVIVSVPGHPGYSVRDVIIAICVVAILSFGAVVPGHDALSTAAEVGAAFGIDISNPAYSAVVTQGQYTRLHPEGVLGLVREAGDAAVATMLRIGGNQLPVVFLLPDQVVLLHRILFAPTNGILPVFSPHAGKAPIPPGSPLEAVYRQSSQIGSTILLALAKLFQDAATNAADSGSKRLTLRGIPPSISLLLPFYYLSLSMNPSASTFNNLGVLLSSLPIATTTVGLSGERVQLTGQLLAVRYYAHGLQLDPTHSHLFTNLGSLFKDMGRLNEAIKMYEKAIEFNPTFDVALANLGNAIKDQGRTQDSIEYYRRSVQANPNFPEALCGLVNALLAVCDWGEVYPESPKEAGWMRDVTNIVARQLDAGTAYGRGAFHAQGSIEQWVDKIMRCLGDRRPETRDRWMEKLLPFYDPSKHTPTMNEGGFMLRIIERLMRRTQHRWYHDLYTRECTNENESGTVNNDAYGRILLPTCLPIPSIPTVLPFHTFTYPLSPRQVRLISHRNALRTSHSTLSQMWLPKHVYPPPPPPGGKLNIGYVSSDFNNHPLAHLMQSVFGFHDLSRFNIFCYATTASDDTPYRKKIEKESQHFLDVSSWSSEKIIQQIQHDKVHILVNLNGYTKGARNDIFAPRPCPVQMQFMGFAGGMASGWTDWLVVDPIVCPPPMTAGTRWREGPSNAHHDGFLEKSTDLAADLDPEDPREDWVYTERFIYMPHSYFVNDHAQGFRDPAEETRIQSVEEEKGELSKEQKEQDVSVQNQLPDKQVWEREELRRWRMRKEVFPDLPDDYVIFADFNQLYKTDPVLFKAWLLILKRVPKSILWLLRFPASGQAHLHKFATEWAGPDVAKRVIFTDVAPKHIHIYRGRIADLFLDTNECNAHTTAADILWSGTPMLTWPKHVHKMCSRVAASILRAAGIDDRLVVHSEKEYVDRVVELANSIHYEYVEQAVHRDGSYELKPINHTTKDVSPSELTPDMLTVNCTEDAVKGAMRVPEGRAIFRRGSGELMDLRRRLFLSRDKCPLFNTRGWTRALEAGYHEAWRRWEAGTDTEDTPEWEALPPTAPEKLSGHIWLGDY